nr:unnamed protein product [Haemonchus contortus]
MEEGDRLNDLKMCFSSRSSHCQKSREVFEACLVRVVIVKRSFSRFRSLSSKYIHLDHEANDNCCIEFGNPRFELPFNVDGKKKTQLHCMYPPIHDLVDIIEKAS